MAGNPKTYPWLLPLLAIIVSISIAFSGCAFTYAMGTEHRVTVVETVQKSQQDLILEIRADVKKILEKK